jgi:hypothetical protein
MQGKVFLAWNNISRFGDSYDSYGWDEFYKFLFMKGTAEFRITLAGNPLIYDCQEFYYINLLKQYPAQVEDIAVSNCSAPLPVAIPFLFLEYVICITSCLDGCTCIERPLYSIFEVVCKGAIENLPEILPRPFLHIH